MGGKAPHFRGKRLALDVSGGGSADVAIFCAYLYGSSSSEQDLLLRQVGLCTRIYTQRLEFVQ